MIYLICEKILLLILVSGMGVICALFSYFLDYCFMPGSIFKWYIPLLARMTLDKKTRETIKNADPETYVPLAENLFWFKILGGCIVCFNIWVAMISFTLICYFSFINWYYCIPYIMVSSWTVRRLI
jgi:hypothetical protein